MICCLAVCLGVGPYPSSYEVTDKYGDVDQSGAVTALDASLALQHTSGIIVIPDPPFEWSDVSGNGKVTAYDAALILQFTAGLIDCFPADPSC